MRNWMPDGSAIRARIGLLTPHMDPVPESEFQVLAPAGVSIHAARVPLGMVGPDGEIIPHVDAAIARAFAEGPAVDQAAALLAAVSPAVIVFAFTSSSYILSRDGDARLKARLERAVKAIPVVIQSVALITALAALGARRIALIHPPWFSDDLDALGAAYFAACGVDVVAHGPARLRQTFGDMPPGDVLDWAVRNTPDAADAVVLGGGGFRAIGALAEIERELGRPVISANQAAFWLALRISGIGDDLPGYGSLFKQPVAPDPC